jgi:PAS domain S-box-containing protein
MRAAETHTVLNVEGDDNERRARSRVLRQAGYQVLEAATDTAARLLVVEALPALVLLGPTLAGAELCRAIKNPSRIDNPLILQIRASGKTMPARAEMLEMDADGWLSEPIEADQLLATARLLLRAREQENENRRLRAKLAESEAAQRQSDARFRELANLAPQIVFTAAPSGRVDFFNEHWSRYTGAEQSADDGWTLVHPDDRDAARRSWAAAVASGAPYEAQFRLRAMDGSYRWHLCRSVPIRGESGRVTQWIGTSTDIDGPRRLHDALRASEERLRLAVQAARFGTYDADIENLRIYCSPELCGIAGLSGADPFDFTAGLDLIHPDDRQAVADLLQASFVSGAQDEYHCEFRIVRPDQDVRWVLLRGRAHFSGEDGRRRPTRALGTVTDITERKRTEEQLRQQNDRLRLLAKAAEQLLVAEDAGAVVPKLFAAVCQYLDVDGYLHYELDESGGALTLVSSAGLPMEVAPALARVGFEETYCGAVAAGRAPLLAEHLEERADPKGEQFNHAGFRAYVGHPLLVADRLLGTLAFASKRRDTFDPDEIEALRTISHYAAMATERLRLLEEARRQADQLARSELRLQLALDTAEVGIYEWQLQTVQTIWDDRLRGHWGMRAGAPVTYDIFMRSIHPADRAAAQAAMEPALDPAGAGRFDTEFRVIGHDDGVERWIKTRGQVFYQNDRPVQLLGTTIDVTERKHAELELITLRDRLAAELAEMMRLHQLGNALLSENDLDAMLKHVLDACNHLLRADKGSVQLYDEKEHCLKLVAQRGFDEAFVETFQIVRDDSTCSCGVALAQGKRIIVDDLASASEFAATAAFLSAYGVAALQSTPLRSQDGQLLGMLSTHFTEPRRPNERELRLLDLYLQQAERVLERRRAEHALRESEERLALAMEASGSGVWDLDLASRQVRLSASFRDMHGFSADEPVSYKRWLLALDKSDCRRLLRYNEELFRGGTEFRFEYRWRHPVSGERWLAAVGRMVRDEAGRPARLIGVNTDITERKISELARARLAAIVENSQDAIFSIDLDGIITSWNRGAEKLYGYPSAEILGQPVSRLVPDRQAEEAQSILRRIVPGEAIENYETRRRRKDGREIDVAITISPIKNRRGEVIGASKIARDISARIIAQDTLWRSEEQLRLAQSAAHVGIWDWEPHSNRLSWTAEMHNLYGVSEPLESYDDWRKLVHVDDLVRVEVERAEAIRQRQPFNIEYRILQSTGEIRWISSRGQGYFDEDGKLLRVIGINMDVTERRRAEEERLMFQALVESSLDFIGMAEPDGKGIYLNPAGRALVGAKSIEEIRQRRPADFVPEQWQGFFHETVLPELVTHGVWEGELPIKHQKSGATIDAYRAFFLVKDPATGKPMCIANVTRDIRERKRAEAELRESEQRFRALADSAPVLIWINGPDGAQFCNSAYREFVGVRDEPELAGFRWADYLHPDDRDNYLSTYSRAFERREPFDADFRFRRADGQYRWMKSLGMPRFTPGGEFLGYAGCSIDIHDAKLAEVQLALLAAVVNSSQDAIYSFTLDTTLVSWNRAAESLFGWTEAEVLGRKWTEFLPPGAGDELEQIVARIRAGEPVTRFETKRQRKDGTIFDVSLTFSPVVAQDKVVAISAVARDVTERKQAEEYREQQARLLELSLDAIIVWDYASGAIEYWNEGAAKLYGYTGGDVFGRSVHQTLQTVFPAPLLEVEKKLREAGEWDGRLVHTQKSGGQVAVLSRMQRIARPQGDVVLEVNRDITTIEEAEQAVAEAAAHVKAIVDTAVDGIITIDERGSIESFNPAAERIFGHANREILGKEISLLMPELAGDLSAVVGEDGGTRETVGRRRDGAEFPIELGLSVTAAGSTRFYTCLVRDASARKEAERALVEAKNAADAANRAKSEFLANMSHEIRNPMTGIMGYADILLARLEDRGAVECVRTIKDSGQYLLQIINDLLDLAKIEAQGLQLEKEEVHLPTFLTDVYTLMEGAARAKGLPLSLRYDGVIPYEIESDSKRLRQILINLLGNAIKFTDRGGVELAVRYDVEIGELQFYVSDSGIGMTQEQQQNLFQPFSQGDSSMTKTYGGTGLGLAITKRLVEALEGRIGVTSVAGQGSTFEVSLPVRVLSGSAFRSIEISPKTPQRLRMAGVRVMIVEDQPDIRRLMEYFIAEAGGAVRTFNGGEAALRAVEQRPDDFDVILMDIQMPRLDGYETTRRIRALGFTKPIIAVTAGAMAGDQAKCFAAGCSDYVTKPIEMAKLLESIMRATSAQRSLREQEQWRQPPLWEESGSNGATVEESEAHVAAAGRRVLVVDDRPVALNATRTLLEMHGFEVRTAATGHAAIRTAGEFLPDYVFLDISLPDISGYEVFRRLKASEELANSKFIALSGHGREESMRARKAGFDAYMTKPVDIQEMEKLISGAPPEKQ